jgi:hypothetical protein
MVFLLAFTHALQPIPFGQYPDRTECERARTAFIRQFANEVAAHRIALACVGPHKPTGR